MAVLVRAGRVLTRAGRWALGRCRSLCCGGCRTFRRFRACPSQDAACGSGEYDFYQCAASTCADGGSIVGRVIQHPVNGQCFRSMDGNLYHRPGDPQPGAIPPAAQVGPEPMFDNRARVFTCVDSCLDAPCPPTMRVARGQPCDPQIAQPHPVYACLTWLSECGVYDLETLGCIRFDPSTAITVAEALAIHPDADILVVPPGPRRDTCCGCSTCQGGTAEIEPACGGAPVSLTCCCPPPYLEGPCQYWGSVSFSGRVYDETLYQSGDRLQFTVTYEGRTDIAADCTITQSGTIRRRLVQTNVGENPIVVYDFTEPMGGPGGPGCGPRWLADLGRNLPVVGTFDIIRNPVGAGQCQGVLSEQFGCLNYRADYTLALDQRDPNNPGSALFTRSAVLTGIMRLEGRPEAGGCHLDCESAQGPDDPTTLEVILEGP